MAVQDEWGRFAPPRTYQPGEYIFHEGDPGSEMFVISRGRVSIIKERDGTILPLSSIDPGEFFGEIGLIREGPRTASALATEETTLHVISRNDFWSMLRSDSEFQTAVLEMLIEPLLFADETRLRAAVSERELFERLSNLSDENKELAELMQLRQETIHFIVHDLRNPLNLINMALQIMEMGERNPEDKAKYIAMAKGGVQRMLLMVDSMLDVERLGKGDTRLDIEVLSLDFLLTQVSNRIRPLAAASDLELVLELPDELSQILGDYQRLDRVVTNLLDNALKFTPPEGILTLRATEHDGFIRVEVNDTGPGIPEDQRQRIFERFAQTDIGREAKGFGLGLSFCRIVIHNHNGEIWVEEGDNGVGTKFVFTLPVRPTLP